MGKFGRLSERSARLSWELMKLSRVASTSEARQSLAKIADELKRDLEETQRLASGFPSGDLAARRYTPPARRMLMSPSRDNVASTLSDLATAAETAKAAVLKESFDPLELAEVRSKLSRMALTLLDQGL